MTFTGWVRCTPVERPSVYSRLPRPLFFGHAPEEACVPMNRIRFVLTAFPRVISAPHWIQLKENLETSLKHFCDKKTVLYSGRTDSIVPEMSADAVVSGVAAGKKAAAYRAVDEWVKVNKGIAFYSTYLAASLFWYDFRMVRIWVLEVDPPLYLLLRG